MNIEDEKGFIRRSCFMIFNKVRVKKPIIVYETDSRNLRWIVIYDIDVVDTIVNAVKKNMKLRWMAKMIPAIYDGNDCLYIDAELYVGDGGTLKELYDIVDFGDRIEFDKLDVIPTKISVVKER
ncbi:MAG: hypothetical protein ACXQS2_06515 [Methermicoccaceae archaeon]